MSAVAFYSVYPQRTFQERYPVSDIHIATPSEVKEKLPMLLPCGGGSISDNQNINKVLVDTFYQT